MVALAVAKPHAALTTVKPPQAIDLACQAVHEVRDHLVNLARLGGGAVTPGLLQAAVDDCEDPVLISDNEAQIVMVNGAAARLLGMSTRELLRLTFWDIGDASFQSDFDILWKEFLRAGRQRGHYIVRHRDGSIVQVAYCSEVNVVPDRNITVLRRLT